MDRECLRFTGVGDDPNLRARIRRSRGFVACATGAAGRRGARHESSWRARSEADRYLRMVTASLCASASMSSMAPVEIGPGSARVGCRRLRIGPRSPAPR